MKRREDSKELAKRCQVIHYIPPESSMWLARDRTEGLVQYFMAMVRRSDWLTSWDYLDTLVRSAYLQGVKDCAEVLAKRALDAAKNS